MPSYRIGFGSDFSLNNSNVGIGTTLGRKKLDVVGVSKGDFNITGVSTLTVYGGFVSQKQNVSLASTIGFSTSGVGTFVQVTESETGYLSLVGEYNTVSEDIIVDEGKIFEVSVGSTVSPGTLESVSIQSHFSFPDGGINDRPDQPTEGMVRFNDDLNTLEFYNGIEWRQFIVSGASGRGVFGGGYDPVVGTIDYINISSTGNALDFGVLTQSRRAVASCSSSTRGLFAGGGSPFPNFNIIDYVTTASAGNALDFGDLLSAGRWIRGLSSSTRGIFAGVQTDNVIQYVQISTLGNALDFGDLTIARFSGGAVASSTRGVILGGSIGPATVSRIDYITISTTGNATYFGDLNYENNGNSSSSNSIRGINFTGTGNGTGSYYTNSISYITIATTGNSIDFGDASNALTNSCSCSTSTRSVFAGGYVSPSVPNSNTIEYVNIMSAGNAQDFGDLTIGRRGMGACSDSHGGLGGF